MCEAGPHFKLCTCSELPLRSNYWKLTRGNKEAYTNAVGSIMRPPDIDEAVHFDAANFVLERLEFDLNNTNAFDFEYDPKERDKIEFHFDEFDNDEGLKHSFCSKLQLNSVSGQLTGKNKIQ